MAVLQPTMSAKAKSVRKPRESMNLKQKTTPKPEKQVLLIAQDVKFAKTLACNDKKLRDRALKRLKKWFQQRYTAHPFTEEDFMRIWKGLFYSMWMSDKPLIQEECAENIANLVHFPDANTSLLFFKCGLLTLMQEWFGIDQLRLDKFLMFTRRLLRQGFVVLRNAGWKKGPVVRFGEVLMESVLKPQVDNVLGLKMHFTDVYLEELAKISEGHISPFTVSQLILPFIKHLALLDDFREINHVEQNIFRNLIRQSDKGIEFEEKYEAWKRSGFAGGSINSVVKQYIPPEERIPPSPQPENNLEKPLDPRAGRVNVELPQIKFNCKEIIQMLEDHKFIEGSTAKPKKTITTLINDFTELSKGRYPLGKKKIILPKNDDNNHSTKLKHSVNRLVKFEKQLMGQTKKQKKRKRESDVDFFANKLQEFIENSERKVKKRKKTVVVDDDDDVANCKASFRRNSGTWYVSDESMVEKPSLASPQPEILEENRSEGKEEEEDDVWDSSDDDTDMSPVFPHPDDVIEEDEEEEEEYNIFIPSRKRKVKEANEKFKKEVVPNPFSKPQTPGSTKKVKIALDLNQSQEFHEHQMQILKSPAIPFDTNRKPAKPLLKPSPVSSPINPFYNKKNLFGNSF